MTRPHETLLFSYGSLQLPAVQRHTFGRLLQGRPDRLPGHRVGEIPITDAAVVEVSGSDRHPAVRATGDPVDAVDGVAYAITWAELAATDRYEVPGYARMWERLESGRHAWVYTDRAQATASLGGTPGPDLPEFTDPDPDPVVLLRRWLAIAARRRVREPGAFVLATATDGGDPSGRVVALKHLDERGLVFGGHADTRKGRDLAENPRATAVFHWRETVQQVVVTGTVSPTSAHESDRLFAGRPAAARAAAAVSSPGHELHDEAVLRDRALRLDDPPRPERWTGYVLAPERIEFWHGREDRLHRRLEYRLGPTGWASRRLQP